MKLRVSIFTKVVLVILLFSVPVIYLYSLSNQVSVSVVSDEIKNESLNQLSFLNEQMDQNVEQLSLLAIVLSQDENVRQFQYINELQEMYDTYSLNSYLEQKLKLQTSAASWASNYIVTSRIAKQSISSVGDENYDDAYITKYATKKWVFREAQNGETSDQFIRFNWEPMSSEFDPVDTALVIESRFSVKNIQKMLDSYKAGGNSDPFLYQPEQKPIMNSKPTVKLIDQVMQSLDQKNVISQDSSKGRYTINIDNTRYLVNYIKSEGLGWYLVDYIPVDNILKPLQRSNHYFYASIIVFIVMGMLCALLFYRQVQVPILHLIRGVRKLKIGDFSARIKKQPGNEFDFLIGSFNEMTEQIEELIENVYKEQIRSREATLKQLQSQINPHFLYNSLFFVKNKAKLGDIDSVVAMTDNLGEYYRYSTRVDSQLPLLEEELHLVQNYLTVQNLRMDRIEYFIEIPESMLKLRLPRLILQPIVENAIIHGLEPKAGLGQIVITGHISDHCYELVVDDNGIGMSEEDIKELAYKMQNDSVDEEAGCGVRNVHQRLQYQFGPGSGLEFIRLKEGLRVVLRWNRQ